MNSELAAKEITSIIFFKHSSTGDLEKNKPFKAHVIWFKITRYGYLARNILATLLC